MHYKPLNSSRYQAVRYQIPAFRRKKAMQNYTLFPNWPNFSALMFYIQCDSTMVSNHLFYITIRLKPLFSSSSTTVKFI